MTDPELAEVLFKKEMSIPPLEGFQSLQLQLFSRAQTSETNIPIHVPWKILTYPLLFLRISVAFPVSHKPRSLLCSSSSKPAQVTLGEGSHTTFLTRLQQPKLTTAPSRLPEQALSRFTLAHNIHILANSQAQPLCPLSIHLKLRLNL